MFIYRKIYTLIFKVKNQPQYDQDQLKRYPKILSRMDFTTSFLSFWSYDTGSYNLKKKKKGKEKKKADMNLDSSSTSPSLYGYSDQLHLTTCLQ